MISKENFTRYNYTFRPRKIKEGKKVKSISFSLVGNDFEGSYHATDLQLQEGGIVSGHVPANKEMLKRERDDQDNLIKKRHFNAVIRGKQNIGIFNRERQSQGADHLLDRVTGGLDYTFNTTDQVNSLILKQLYGTRFYQLHDVLNNGDLFKFHATSLTVNINGSTTRNYSGYYHLIPAVLGLYTVDTGGGAGYLVCEADTWLKGSGGERL